MRLSDYRLPDGRLVKIDEDVARGAESVSFELKAEEGHLRGEIVQARRVTLRQFKVVGWFCADPHDENASVFPKVAFVRKETLEQAVDAGRDALLPLVAKPGLDASGIELLNWFTSEVRGGTR